MSEQGGGDAGHGVSVIVVTMGLSPWLLPCLEGLRQAGEGLIEAGERFEILLVDQAPEGCPLPPRLADRTFRPGKNLGFAAANNLALAHARGKFIALVNDDVLLEDGWLAPLLQALEGQRDVGAVQGVNLRMDQPRLADGCGLRWNPRWQAVQIDHGEAAPGAEEPPHRVFGVSATAALFSRQALEAVAGPGFQVFDPGLGSYYEDVDLACRLRRRGLGALLVPASRARHAGSTTGEAIAEGSALWIYSNRILVLARWLGRGFWWRLPFLFFRDLVDLLRNLGKGDPRRAAGIAKGWARALRKLPDYAHLGRQETLRDDPEAGPREA